MSFIKHTITGGVMILLPIALLLVLFGKIFSAIRKMSMPLSKKLPDLILGLDGSGLITIFIILLLCFIGGLMVKAEFMQTFIKKIEDNILTFIPGYSLIKSLTASTLGQRTSDDMPTVMVKDGETWKFGYLAEESDGLSAIFFPEAPRSDSGEVNVLPSGLVSKLDMTTFQMSASLKHYGKDLIRNAKRSEILKK